MDRARRLGSLWNWLPVFRAVAETEHLNEAAKALHVSPSAVSRTIKLLEEDIGHDLFTRRGRMVRLNDRGRSLLASVRDAMRRIDDSITQISEPNAPTELRVACAGDHALSFLSRILMRPSPERRALPIVTRRAASEIPMLLFRGEIDISFGYDALRVPGLCIREIGRVTHGVYCGRSHPLAARRDLSIADLSVHSFVAPSNEESEGARDLWPAEVPRVVAIYLPSLAAAIEICGRGEAIAVLPDGLPMTSGAPDTLVRLPLDVIAPAKLYASYREPLGDGDLASRLADEMRVEMAR